MPCWIYLRADPNSVQCNEAADVVIQRLEEGGSRRFIHLTLAPYAHDDEPRTGFVCGADVAAVLPMHPREFEAELDDPPDWYARGA